MSIPEQRTHLLALSLTQSWRANTQSPNEALHPPLPPTHPAPTHTSEPTSWRCFEFICINVFIIRICIIFHRHRHVCIFVYICARVYVCMCLCVCVYTYIYICIYIYIHVYMYIYIYMWILCVYMYIYNMTSEISTHTHTHTCCDICMIWYECCNIYFRTKVKDTSHGHGHRAKTLSLVSLSYKDMYVCVRVYFTVTGHCLEIEEGARQEI